MWRKEGIFQVLSRVKVATEPHISQKRDCNEKWLQPLTSRMNQCVHVLVTTDCPSRELEGPFLQVEHENVSRLVTHKNVSRLVTHIQKSMKYVIQTASTLLD